MLARVESTRVVTLRGFHSKVGMTLLANVTLGWIWLVVTSTLNYFSVLLVSPKKVLLNGAYGLFVTNANKQISSLLQTCPIKFFTSLTRDLV
jgi:hypothetical protein